MFNPKDILLSSSVIISLSTVQHFIALAIGILTLIHIIMQVVAKFPESKASWMKISRRNKMVIAIIGAIVIAFTSAIIYFFG